MLPKKLHMYWGGDNPVPEMAKETLRAAKAAGYETLMWGGDAAPSISPAYDWAVKNKRWSIASEVVRHWAVLIHGGIYMDTDMEWRSDPYEHIKDYEWFCTGETPQYCNAAFSGGVADNTISYDMMKQIDAINFDTWRPSRPMEVEVGPHMLTAYWDLYVGRIEKSHPIFGCVRTIPGTEKPVAILPMAKFFGLDYLSYHRKIRPIPQDSLLVHHWAKTW